MHQANTRFSHCAKVNHNGFSLNRFKPTAWACLSLISLYLIPTAHANDLEWRVYGGNALHNRHSPASLITPSNIGQLQEAWEFDTGIDNSFQATPIVHSGVMYVSLPFNHVVALDAATGQLKWRYTHQRRKDRPMCCGPANRGVAVEAGLVFMGTIDGRLIALDAKTGKLRWDTDVLGQQGAVAEDAALLQGQLKGEVSGASGAGLNMAPMVVNGKVIIGITGVGYGLHLDSARDNAPLGSVVGIAGQYGSRGHMAAYNAQTGKLIWKFHTVPEQGWEGEFRATTPDGVRLPRDIEAERQNAVHFPDAWKFGGGSAWSTPAIDVENGLLIFGTGNPSPQMEGSSRPGDNLYTASLVALDIETGRVKWHYQQVPHDMWGYDVASPPVFFTFDPQGKKIPAVGQAGKTGWFYAHNRLTGELLYKSEPFVPQWNMFTPATPEGNTLYPGVVGGSNWSPTAVDEDRRQVVIAGIHWPVEYKLHEIPAQGDKPAVKYSSMSPKDNEERYGVLSAIHLDTGKIKWLYKTPSPLIGGVLSTQTGLVFSGRGEGELNAYDADKGIKLWTGKAKAGVNAPPITYVLGDTQYVAVAVGGNKLFGFKTGQTVKVWSLKSNQAQ